MPRPFSSEVDTGSAGYVLAKKKGPTMIPKRQSLTTRGLAFAILMLFCGLAAPAGAQTFPNKPIRIIVPFAAGGGSDTVTRIVANKLADRLGQPITIENRGGAGGNLGMEAGARAAPDGYTLTVVTQNLVVNPHLYKNLNYNPTADFRPIRSEEPRLNSSHT